MLKMISTSDFVTTPECTEFVFGRGSASDPARGAYSVPTDPLAGLTGVGRKVEGKEEGAEGEGNSVDPLHLHFPRTPLVTAKHSLITRITRIIAFSAVFSLL